ncbi:MAG: radical SAM protein, partial [Oscillospiraceae bacterium]|nr:radical SAM protein [Oscillospiraceae bacterium]
MTREERYASIYSHDTVYCPPQEEGCAMLEVALGCSWGKCLFCDFAKDKFYIHPMEKIEENLKVLGELLPEKDRVFFLGENALCLDTEKLLAIMEMTK